MDPSPPEHSFMVSHLFHYSIFNTRNNKLFILGVITAYAVENNGVRLYRETNTRYRNFIPPMGINNVRNV